MDDLTERERVLIAEMRKRWAPLPEAERSENERWLAERQAAHARRSAELEAEHKRELTAMRSKLELLLRKAIELFAAHHHQDDERSVRSAFEALPPLLDADLGFFVLEVAVAVAIAREALACPPKRAPTRRQLADDLRKVARATAALEATLSRLSRPTMEALAAASSPDVVCSYVLPARSAGPQRMP